MVNLLFFIFIIGLELSSELFRLLRWPVSLSCRHGVSFRGFSIKAEMERCFSVETKAFYFSMKADVSEIHLEERRKGFCGFTFLGLQCSTWSVEEALKEPVKKDFVMSYREDVKAWMVRGGGNKAGHYLEVATYAECGCKGVIWLLKGREGWGWFRLVGELQKMLTCPGSKAHTSKGIQKGGASPSRLGGASPSFAEVVHGEAVFLVKHPGLRVSELRAALVGLASGGVV